LGNTSNLNIGNTVFAHKRKHKTTWTSPDGFTKNEIDYICISTRWRSSPQDVRAYRGGGRWLRPQSGGRKDPAKTKEIEAASYTRPYAIEGLKNE